MTRDQIVFQLNLDRIRNDTDEIATLACALVDMRQHTLALCDYDLKQSALNLRKAADCLDAIRAKADALMLQAAE